VFVGVGVGAGRTTNAFSGRELPTDLLLVSNSSNALTVHAPALTLVGITVTWRTTDPPPSR
jgi:hypothetical protein